MLDSFFDDGKCLRSNRATVDYVRAIAAAEGLDLDARLGNPTGGGIHMKQNFRLYPPKDYGYMRRKKDECSAASPFAGLNSHASA